VEEAATAVKLRKNQRYIYITDENDYDNENNYYNT
jgi:hypothetical protein